MGHVSGNIAEIVFSNDALAGAFDYFVIPTAPMSDADLSLVGDSAAREILNSAMYPIIPAVADARHGSAIVSFVYLALAYRPLGQLIVPEAIRRMHIPPEPVDLGGHLRNVVKGLPSAIAVSADFLWRRHVTRSRLPGFFIRSRNRRYRLAYYSEQIPQPDSRITLSIAGSHGPGTDPCGPPISRNRRTVGRTHARTVF